MTTTNYSVGLEALSQPLLCPNNAREGRKILYISTTENATLFFLLSWKSYLEGHSYELKY